MSHEATVTFDAIQLELDEILRMLREWIDRAPEAPEVWRLRVAEKELVSLRQAVGRDDVPARDRYQSIVWCYRGINRGWADSSEEFARPGYVSQRLHALYDQVLPLSGEQ